MHPSGRFVRDLPRSIEPDIREDYRVRKTAVILEKFLIPLHYARIYGETGLVVLPDGMLAAESFYGQSVLGPEQPTLNLRIRPGLKRGTFFSLLSLWDIRGGRNYYHWMHDTLMNLCFVLELLPPKTKFIVRPGLADFHLESLALLGISPERLIVCKPDECWELETLLYTAPTNHSGWDYPAANLWFQAHMLHAAGARPARQRRLFISRRQTQSRRIVNEVEVEDFLKPHGFETCMPELFSVREQISLFAEAEMVVGVHGAGLTNFLFAPKGAVALEIMEPSFVHDTYMFWSMSEALGLKYWNFWGESVPNPGNSPDISVPIEKLVGTFSAILVEEPPRESVK